ncbi:hypothetical protein [Alicyclobacillus fastidiosus]|uniref:hypothetical protein n=1 Tax=Alicyclobacillus fastidiosus TaxID=392011 RepID=UPI0023EA37F0|nr:hypothetical protein [Alicyclobacillus fastidiosus]GMA63462.1 hypothetical protein GCM10025859_39020 [Alicyclobacillus fastidiosus]
MKSNYKWLVSGVALSLLVATGCGEQATTPSASESTANTSANTTSSVNNDTANTAASNDANGTGSASNTDQNSTTGSSDNPTTSGSNSSSVDYVNYTNPRFGFSLSVPAAYQKGPAPEDGDGQGWSTDNNSVTVRAFGQYNVQHETVKSVAASLTANEQVTYQQSGSNWCVVSGYEGSNIVYEKVFVGAPTCTNSRFNTRSPSRVSMGQSRVQSQTRSNLVL